MQHPSENARSAAFQYWRLSHIVEKSAERSTLGMRTLHVGASHTGNNPNKRTLGYRVSHYAAIGEVLDVVGSTHEVEARIHNLREKSANGIDDIGVVNFAFFLHNLETDDRIKNFLDDLRVIAPNAVHLMMDYTLGDVDESHAHEHLKADSEYDQITKKTLPEFLRQHRVFTRQKLQQLFYAVGWNNVSLAPLGAARAVIVASENNPLAMQDNFAPLVEQARESIRPVAA